MKSERAMAAQLSGEVTITGIGARPELNGQLARILRFDGEAQRYLVKLGDGTKVKMKAANLIPAEDEVTVVERQDVRGQGFDDEPALGREVLPGEGRRGLGRPRPLFPDTEKKAPSRREREGQVQLAAFWWPQALKQ